MALSIPNSVLTETMKFITCVLIARIMVDAVPFSFVNS